MKLDVLLIKSKSRIKVCSEKTIKNKQISRSMRLIKRRDEAGLCRRCLHDVVQGERFCKDHLKMTKDYSKFRYREVG